MHSCRTLQIYDGVPKIPLARSHKQPGFRELSTCAAGAGEPSNARVKATRDVPATQIGWLKGIHSGHQRNGSFGRLAHETPVRQHDNILFQFIVVHETDCRESQGKTGNRPILEHGTQLVSNTARNLRTRFLHVPGVRAGTGSGGSSSDLPQTFG